MVRILDGFQKITLYLKHQLNCFNLKRTNFSFLEHETEQKIAEFFKGSILNKVRGLVR